MPGAGPIREQVEVCIGKAGVPIGSLVYVRQGRRENCAFSYDEAWLTNSNGFSVSTDLPFVAGYHQHKAASPHDSVFHGALADTSPDAWGRRVIARDHAKRRRADPRLSALTELDYLLSAAVSRTNRPHHCCRRPEKKIAAIRKLPMPSAPTAMLPPRMYASFGVGCCSTC